MKDLTFKGKIKSITKDYSFSYFSGGTNNKDDDVFLDLSTAKNTYNFNVSSSCLKEGLGLEDLSLPTDTIGGTEKLNMVFSVNPLSIHFYHYYNTLINPMKYDDDFLVYGSDNKLYRTKILDSTHTLTPITTLSLTSSPISFNAEVYSSDALLLSNENDGLIVYSYRSPVVTVKDVQSVTSMSYLNERVYASVNGNKKRVIYSDEKDPTNWVESLTTKYIRITDGLGAINKVVSLDNYIYAIRDYGIMRISPYIVTQNFNIAIVYTSSVRIYAKTACVCNDKIIFLQEDGIYESNGLTTKKISTSISGYFKDNQNAVAVYHNNKYYLSCSLKYDGEEQTSSNNTLIEIDGTKFNFLKGVNIIYLMSINCEYCNKLVALEKIGDYNYMKQVTYCGKDRDNPTIKVWESGLLDFGESDKTKQIKSLTLLTKTDITLLLESEFSSETIKLKGLNEYQTIHPTIYGKKIRITISCNSTTCYISNIKLSILMRL